jgi:hypothetical protein
LHFCFYSLFQFFAAGNHFGNPLIHFIQSFRAEIIGYLFSATMDFAGILFPSVSSFLIPFFNHRYRGQIRHYGLHNRNIFEPEAVDVAEGKPARLAI